MHATLILTPVPGLHAITLAELRGLGDRSGLPLEVVSTPGGVIVSAAVDLQALSALLSGARSVRAASFVLLRRPQAGATLAGLEEALRALAPQLALPPGAALDVRLEGSTGLPEPPQEVAQRLGEALLSAGDDAAPEAPSAPLEAVVRAREASLEVTLRAPWSPDAVAARALERTSPDLDAPLAFALLCMVGIDAASEGLLIEPFGADDGVILRVAAGVAPQLRRGGLGLEEGARLAERCDAGAVDFLVTHPPQHARLRRQKNAEELQWRLLDGLSHALRIGGRAAFTTPSPGELLRMLRRFPELEPLEQHTAELRGVPLTLCALQKTAQAPEGRLRGLVGKSRRS